MFLWLFFVICTIMFSIFSCVFIDLHAVTLMHAQSLT